MGPSEPQCGPTDGAPTNSDTVAPDASLCGPQDVLTTDCDPDAMDPAGMVQDAVDLVGDSIAWNYPADAQNPRNLLGGVPDSDVLSQPNSSLPGAEVEVPVPALPCLGATLGPGDPLVRPDRLPDARSCSEEAGVWPHTPDQQQVKSSDSLALDGDANSHKAAIDQGRKTSRVNLGVKKPRAKEEKQGHVRSDIRLRKVVKPPVRFL